MSTRSGEFEDGAEVYLLSDEDLNHNFAKDFFQIKLGYNGIHHYFPIVPKGVMQFFDAFNSVTHYSINLRKVLKSPSDQAPRDTNFQKLVSIAHQNLVATTVLSGLNPLTGATGTARTATPADFGFPVAPEPGKPSSSSGKSSGKKRRLDPASETYQQDEKAEQEEQEEEDVVFQQGDTDDSPEITIKHNVQLKKLATQCFCGKSGFKTPAEVEKHRLAVHTGHGKGVNPETKRQRDYWKCNQCNEVSGDPPCLLEAF